LDGIVGNEDRIVIATTNHINKLDPALIREGRFDLKVHVGYMTDETLRTYIDRMYPNFGESHLYSVKENIAPCLMQKLVFANRGNPVPVLDQVAVRNTEFKTAQVNKLLANIPNP
jgi:chaperone BCS1